MSNAIENKNIRYISSKIGELQEDELLQHLVLRKILEIEDSDGLRYFVESGLNINARDDENSTVVHKLKNVTITFFEEMLQFGLNIFAINFYGVNALFKLVHENLNFPLQRRLMELGVNPNDRNFSHQNCLWLVKLSYVTQPKEFYLEYFPYATEKVVKEINQFLSKGQAELALEIIQSQITNLGGFQHVFNNLDKKNMSKLIYNLQQTYIYLGRNQEAVAIIKFFLNNIQDDRKYNIVNFLDISVAFVEGEYETLFEYAKFIIKQSSSYNYMKHRIVFEAYVYAKLMNYKEEERYFFNFFKKSTHTGDKMLLVRYILTAKDEAERIKAIENLEDSMNYYNTIANSELTYALGLYCLLEDKVRAELILRKVMELSILNHNDEFLKEYGSALILTKYLEETNAELS